MYYRKKSIFRSVKMAALLAVVLLAFGLYKGYEYFQKPEPPAPPPVEERKPPAPIPVPKPRDEEPPPPPIPERVSEDKYWLHIAKGAYRLYLYNGRDLERTFRIAVGTNEGQKQRVGDKRTPTGSFSVQQIQNSSSWTHDFRDGAGEIRGAYGPWFIRLKTPGWSGIGIHGTHAPDSIGTRATEGCIRLRNEDLVQLKERVFVGMKVVISE